MLFATGVGGAITAAAIIAFRTAFVMAETVGMAVAVLARPEYCTSNLPC